MMSDSQYRGGDLHSLRLEAFFLMPSPRGDEVRGGNSKLV